MFDFLFGNKGLISEKVLAQNKIKVLNRKDITYDKSNLLTTTGSGKYYTGFLNKEPVTIKEVEIMSEESLINEYSLWKEFQENENFLHFMGTCIGQKEAILVFNSFVCTIDQALSTRMIKDDQQRSRITSQILKILNILNTKGMIHRDLRPGIFGLTGNYNVQLLDFGFLIDERLPNKEFIDRIRLKYMPPEALQFDFIDKSFDLWSFGCLLIDLFSQKQPIYKINPSREEIYAMHDNDNQAFPIIPSDIQGFLRDVISKCLERKYKDRISMVDLMKNMKIFLDTSDEMAIKQKNILLQEMNKIEKEKELNEESNRNLQELSDYVFTTTRSVNQMNRSISDDLIEGLITMKNDLTTTKENSIKNINNNVKIIKQKLDELAEKNIGLVNQLYGKVIEDTLKLQEYVGFAYSDVIDAQNNITDMKISLNSLSKIHNPDKYSNSITSLYNNKNTLTDHITKYSTNSNYDKIFDKIGSNKNLSENYLNFCNSSDLQLENIYNYVDNYEDNFFKNSNIKELSDQAKMEVKTELKKTNSIFAKIQENSNIVIIYLFDNKEIIQKKVDKHFPLKSYSIFNNNNIYYSGGLNKVNNNEALDTLIHIKIFQKFDEYEFEFDESSSLPHPRYSHSMIPFQNYIIIIGGTGSRNKEDNQLCFIYNINSNTWANLPSLKTTILNPSLTIINDEHLICCNAGSISYNNTEAINKLALNNLERICFKKEKGFEDVLGWEEISYSFNFDNGRLKRGMGLICIGGAELYLVGGFDNDKSYDNVWRLSLREGNEQENEGLSQFVIDKTEMQLPIRTFFNNNFLVVEERVIMVDGYNNAIEMDCVHKKIYYYT